MIHRLIREQDVAAPSDEVWAYFATPKNLNEMTPPDMHFEIVYGAEETMRAGQLIEYRVKFMPFVRSRWLTEIAHVVEGRCFVDEQRIGPYRFWYHEHSFEALGTGTRVRDVVSYALPFGWLGDVVHALWVRRKLEGIFEFRRQRVEALFGPRIEA